MKLLVVAMSDSIHTARWISQISDQGWEIHLFPSIDNGKVHPEIKDLIVHHSLYSKNNAVYRDVTPRGIPLLSDSIAMPGRKLLKKYFPQYRITQLKRLIEKIRPAIVHSLEIQNAGYLTLEAKRLSRVKFPPWIVTNWGSDIYLFGRLSKHKPKILEVLASCDYYSCECQRDVYLAKDFGFKGMILPVFPNTGGFDLEYISQFRQPGKVSSRRLIMLKGYQHWAGRALVGLRALERCSDLLKGYRVVVYSASSDVVIAAELFSDSTGIPVTIIPYDTPNLEILKLHGQARIAIGLSISDAISTSLLESISMGSVPIQSWTSCANEWIEDGKNGFLVPPEDPDVVEVAIRRALTDDDLVNRAAEENFQLCKKRLNYDLLKTKTIEFYSSVAK